RQRIAHRAHARLSPAARRPRRLGARPALAGRAGADRQGTGRPAALARAARVEGGLSAVRGRAPFAHEARLPGHRPAPRRFRMEVSVFPAPAKLNLFLHVLAKRADGYHELQTVFRLVDRSDQVRITPRADGQLRFAGPFGDDNLCLRAARLLKTHTSCRLGADIELEKRLPVGGGLGGGSSDAATVLLALNRLWRLRLARADLLQLAPKLGADVAFFIYGRNAL